MGFVSILNPEVKPETEVFAPSFFVDLNLDQIVKEIQSRMEVPVEKLFYRCQILVRGRRIEGASTETSK